MGGRDYCNVKAEEERGDLIFPVRSGGLFKPLVKLSELG
jgi:hypothetical protein